MYTNVLPSITKALFYVQKLNVAETASAQIADDINSYRYLEANKKKQKINLLKQRGKTGAVEKLAYIIFNSIKQLS